MSKKGQKIREEEGLDNSSLFEIDLSRLDDEWMRHAAVFFEWASRLTDARAELDELKRDEGVIASETDLAIRTNPEQFGLSKITEPAVKNAIAMAETVKTAQQAFQKQKHRVDILQDVVNALDRKKRGLEKEVDLHGQKYFATPRASENSREAVEDFKKKSARTKRDKKARYRDQD